MVEEDDNEKTQIGNFMDIFLLTLITVLSWTLLIASLSSGIGVIVYGFVERRRQKEKAREETIRAVMASGPDIRADKIRTGSITVQRLRTTWGMTMPMEEQDKQE